MEDEFCSACASAGDKVLVEASDPPFPEEVEHNILLNIRYDREVCEIVLNRFGIASGKELVELSQQSQLIELRDNTSEFHRIYLAERVGAMNDIADFLNRHSTLLEQETDYLMGEDIVSLLMNYRPFEPSFSGSLDQNRGFQNVVRGHGQNDSARSSTRAVSTATDALDQPCRFST